MKARKIFQPILILSFILLVILTSAVSAEPTTGDMNPATVIRVSSGGLSVFNDGSMLTRDGGQIEMLRQPILPNVPVEPQSVEHIQTTTEVVRNNDEESSQETVDSTVIRVVSGGLIIFNDGSMETVEGGKVEILPYQPGVVNSDEQVIEFVPMELSTVESSQSSLMPVFCPTDQLATGTSGIGSTTYQRKLTFCLNNDYNEVVKKIRITNIGGADTPILYDEKLARHGCPTLMAWNWDSPGGPWIIAPGAYIEWQPWVELVSGQNVQSTVYEQWQGATHYSCFGS